MDDYQKLRTSWTMLQKAQGGHRASQLSDFSRSGGIPYPDQPVVAACEQAPVRQCCNRVHLAVVLAKLYRASAWYA